MRNFLTDKKIIGAMLVSRSGDILHYSIPELLKWTDWILIMFDNEDKKTRQIVKKYQKQYQGRIRIADSGFPRIAPEKEGQPSEFFIRFNRLQGPIRESLLKKIQNYMRKGEKIDIVIWLDDDEILLNYATEFLQFLINRDDKKALIMRTITVFGDMRTIMKNERSSHLRIFKPSLDQYIVPYRGLCHIWPITKSEKQMFRYGYVHLATLTQEKREWRFKNWRFNRGNNNLELYNKLPLWKLDKDAIELSPEECLSVFKRLPDLTIGQYLKEHNLEF